jgi:FMN phosphatase YigB (HAD superfamily)
MSRLDAVFLDAGGVLVFPNWFRISDALAKHGVSVDPLALAAAEPHAKRSIDTPATIQLTHDASRGWMYFNLILQHAGVDVSEPARAAIEELHEYHKHANLWDLVPDEVVPALTGMRSRALRLVVVSNSNGTLRRLLERLELANLFDCIIDSHEVGVEKPDARLFDTARTERCQRESRSTSAICMRSMSSALALRIRGVATGPGGLYANVDCPRVRSLEDLLQRIDAGISTDRQAARPEWTVRVATLADASNRRRSSRSRTGSKTFVDE